MTDEFRERTLVTPETAKAAVETKPFVDTFQEIDYQLYREGTSTGMEIAEETYGYLAALPDLDPARDFDHLVVYVTDPLDDLAERVPDSHFTYIAENTDGDACRIRCDGGGYVDFVFGESHGETCAFATQYHNVEFALPTHDAYVAYSEAHGVGPDSD